MQLVEYVDQLKAIHTPESHRQQGIYDYERARSEGINPIRGSLPYEGYANARRKGHTPDICISACPRKICTAMAIRSTRQTHIVCQKLPERERLID